MLKMALRDIAVNEKCQLPCWRRMGYLPSFFVPTTGDLTESPSPGICHPRQKNANARGSARRGREGGRGLGVAGIDWCINHDDTHSLVLRMSTTVCKFERFSSRNVQLLFKESIGMTFKNKKKGNLWIKCHCSVISELIEVNVFLNGFKFNEICVYTYDLSKSNPRAYGFLISKEICMWYTRFFSANRRCSFFGLFQT